MWCTITIMITFTHEKTETRITGWYSDHSDSHGSIIQSCHNVSHITTVVFSPHNHHCKQASPTLVSTQHGLCCSYGRALQKHNKVECIDTSAVADNHGYAVYEHCYLVHVHMFRFLILCIHCTYGCITQLALDTLSNVAVKVSYAASTVCSQVLVACSRWMWVLRVVLSNCVDW